MHLVSGVHMVFIFSSLNLAFGNDLIKEEIIENKINISTATFTTVLKNENHLKLSENNNINYSNDSYDYFNMTLERERHLESIREYIFHLESWAWVLIILHTLVFIIGVVGNILVCVAVFRNHWMLTVTNCFIANLAVADFLVILFCLPPSLIWDLTQTWFFGVAMCKIVLYLQAVSVTVSVLTLAFISLDRWYAICFPLKFKSTNGRVKTVIIIIWVFALICGTPEAIYSTTIISQELEVETIYFTQCGPTWSDRTDTIFLMIKMIFLYFLPLIFMTLAYLKIIKVLWRSGNVQHTFIGFSAGGKVNCFTSNVNNHIEGQLRSRRKAAKMLVVVVLMFAICYFPVYLLSFLRVTTELTNSELNRAFALLSKWMCYANSAVNPIIYNFMSGKFRKEFRKAFQRCCKGSKQPRNMGPSRKTTERESALVFQTQSKTDIELNKINTSAEYKYRHTRKATKTSLLEN